jgi:hypothetical protein
MDDGNARRRSRRVPSNITPPTSSSLPSTPKGARKRVRASSPSLSAPTGTLLPSRAAAAILPVHGAGSDSLESPDVADKEGLASGPPPLMRSISSDSYFISAIEGHPSISLFLAHSPRSDFSLLCDDSVLSALNDGLSPGPDTAIVSTEQQPTPLSRLKVPSFSSSPLLSFTLTCLRLLYRECYHPYTRHRILDPGTPAAAVALSR